MHETLYKSFLLLNPICITKQKLLFERERERGKGLVKSRIQTCVFLLCFMLLSLSVPLFFVLSMFLLCVNLLSFSVFAFFFLPSVLPFLFLFFFFTCAYFSLFIERFQRNCSLFFSQLIRSWSSFRQFFSSTTPNFMFSRDPLFSLFLFYLFCCFLSSFFLFCDSPTFRLLRPNFIKPCSLLSGDATSLFTFQLFILFYFTWFVSIFFIGTRQQTTHVAFIFIFLV